MDFTPSRSPLFSLDVKSRAAGGGSVGATGEDALSAEPTVIAFWPAVRPRRLLGLALLGAAVWLLAAQFQALAPRPLTPVVLGTPNVLYSGLTAVAEDQGYFREVGLDVTVREFPSGAAALGALAAGEIQMAMASDFAFVSRRLTNPSLQIVASLSSADTHEAVARLDSGVRRPADLKGKRIGFSLGSSSEYYLGAFLLAHSISPAEATPVDIPPEELPAALAAGRVDAIVTWEAYAWQAAKLLADRAVIWSAQGDRDFAWILAVRQEEALASAVKAALDALAKAEEFVIRHEERAKAIVARRWRLDPEFMDRYWRKVRLSLTLDQALVIGLEDAAAWRLGLASEQSRTAPDVLDYVSAAAMDKVAPQAVTIFR